LGGAGGGTVFGVAPEGTLFGAAGDAAPGGGAVSDLPKGCKLPSLMPNAAAIAALMRGPAFGWSIGATTSRVAESRSLSSGNSLLGRKFLPSSATSQRPVSCPRMRASTGIG
jgi:hypothetical protein